MKPAANACIRLLNRVGLCACGNSKCTQCQLDIQAVVACGVLDELTKADPGTIQEMQNWASI